MYVYDVAVEDEYQQDQFQSAFERVSLTGIWDMFNGFYIIYTKLCSSFRAPIPNPN